MDGPEPGRFELAVLHYDADYYRFAAITEQDAEWIVPRGSADG